MQPAASLDPRNLRSAPGRPHPNPLLLLCRLMIERAFRSACYTHDGVPTQDACDAVEWITSRLDWTGTGSVPPEDIRTEFYMSFEYCCRWLDLDPDQIRRSGLPRDVATLDPGNRRRMHTRPRNDHGRNSRPHVAGLAAVYGCWARASARHPAKIDEHESVDSAPLSEADTACHVSI